MTSRLRHVPRRKTVEKEDIRRDLISLEVIVHTTQYVGKKTECPHCKKEYLPKFPDNVKSIVNYDEGIKALVVYLNSYCNVPNQKVAEFLNFISDKKINMCHGTVLSAPISTCLSSLQSPEL